MSKKGFIRAVVAELGIVTYIEKWRGLRSEVERFTRLEHDLRAQIDQLQREGDQLRDQLCVCQEKLTREELLNTELHTLLDSLQHEPEPP